MAAIDWLRDLDAEGWSALAAWGALVAGAASWLRAGRARKAANEALAELHRVSFVIERRTRDTYVLRNSSKMPATGVEVVIDEESKGLVNVLSDRHDLAPNQGIELLVMGGGLSRRPPVDLAVKCDQLPDPVHVALPARLE